MADAEEKLTVDELKKRWETPVGKKFRAEILQQLQNEETGHRVDFDTLQVEEEGKEYLWEDFTGVHELEQNRADLRGVDFSGENLENASLILAHLENADLWEAHLEHANLGFAHLENADLTLAHLEHADLMWAHLEHADLSEAHLESSILWDAHLEHANLGDAHLEHANLGFAHLENADVTDACFHLKSFWWRTGLSKRMLRLMRKRADGSLVKSLLRWLYKKLEGLDADVPDNALKPTNLTGAEIKNVRLDSDPVLYRDLLDEQYLDRFAGKHKIMYPFWLCTSNCGRSIALVLLWSLLFSVVFGLIYADFVCPSWFPFRNFFDSIDPRFTYQGQPQTRVWQPFYLSFVTMTTLGLASSEPSNWFGYFWHTAQNFFGYIWLGYLIAVLGSKLTRRSS